MAMLQQAFGRVISFINQLYYYIILLKVCHYG